MHEATLHEKTAFLTLTYDEKHLPENGQLEVTDWQKFAKRVRHKKGPFRFFHCGEYGDQTDRPHYHAIVYGLDFAEDRKIWRRGDKPTWRSVELDELWGNGTCDIGVVTPTSAAYVARYVMKKMGGAKAKDHYTRVNFDTGEEYQLKPEYATMSRRPGLGTGWISKWHPAVYRDDSIVVNGKEQQGIKFYDKWMEKNGKGEELERAKEERKKKGIRHENNRTKEKLEIREVITRARIRERTRGN